MMSGSCPSRWVHRICRVYAAMICAYPKEFRVQFGREIEQVFRDSCRAAFANKGLLRFIPRMLWDWLRTSFGERLAAFRSLEVPIKGWWLLALCGIIDAICGGIHVLIAASMSLRRFDVPNTAVWDMCMLAVVAGACSITAGLWNSGRCYSWLLSLHGVALSAFGLIGVSPLARGHLGFRPISLLFVLMAVSAGAFALGSAQLPGGGAAGRWLLSVSGAGSLGFACSFLAVGFGWVRFGPPPAYWIWMSSYFGFTALCMLSIAVRLHQVGPSQPGLAA